MNQLRDYTGKQLQNALHLLKQYHSASNEEVLHQLRVSLKKLKAVLDYLLILHPKKVKPLRKKIQLVFHASGTLREAQLRFLWLRKKQFHYLLKYASLEKKIKEEVELFVLQKEDYFKQLSTIENESDKYLKKIKEDDLLNYALDLKQQLEQQLLVMIQNDWHALRKLIKQYLYVHHWLSEKDKLKVLTVTAYQKMDQLQEKIGLWHDAIDLLQWLTDQQFFLSKDKSVSTQFNKAFVLVKKDIEAKEKEVMNQLKTIKSRSTRNN